MIPRYSRPDAAQIWSEENKFKIFARLEQLALEGMSNAGLVPNFVPEIVKQFSSFDVKQIDEIEKIVKHDVIAFLTNLTDNIRSSAQIVGNFSIEQINLTTSLLHFGLTSSDILDTTFAIQLSESLDLVLSELSRILEIFKSLAVKYKNQLCMGRTHGIHAEPISFGLKLLNFYEEFRRAEIRIRAAQKEIQVCMFSGPVGSFSGLGPQIEQYIADQFDFAPAVVSTQVISRDRFASVFAALALLASSIEHFAIEIRHLQRSEVDEVREGFALKQKGSSAMPHKKNPILSENLTGLARLIRGYLTPALENVALWHERDISHSSVERVSGPGALILSDFALSRLGEMLENLDVNPAKMIQNIDSMRGLHLSHITLLSIIKLGYSREDAYTIVQKSALEVYENSSLAFFTALERNDDLLTLLDKHNLNAKEFLSEIKDYDYLKHTDYVFKKILG